MNKKIIILIIFIALMFALFLYFNYKKSNSNDKKESDTLYFLQVAALRKYENVTKMSKLLPSYLVIKEDDLYHIYVAITKDKNNLKKLKEFYINNGNDIYVKEKNETNEDLLNYIVKFDFLLEEANDKETIINISKNVIKKYEELKYE